MTKLQINLDEEENKIVSLFKVLKGYQTKEVAVKQIIRNFKPNLKKLN